MNKKNNTQERRMRRRFSVEDSGAVMVSPNSIISYCLLDISESGLAFSYNGTKAEKWIGKNCFLDFFGEDFSLENIPVKIISDNQLNPADLPPRVKEELAPSLRRCGIQFLGLTDTQKESFSNYIKMLKLEEFQKRSVVIKIRDFYE